MRLTNTLCAQHIGWHFKKHWLVQGRRVVRDTGAAAELANHNINVVNPEDIFKKAPPVWLDEFNRPTITTSDDKSCYIYNDCNLLPEGVAQARALTKAIEIKGFPNLENALKETQQPNESGKILNALRESVVFDAEQVKLKKRKAPGRPMVVLPRDYGISPNRVRRLLLHKMLMECEKKSGVYITSRRRIFDNASCNATIPTKSGDPLQFQLKINILITSKKPIAPTTGVLNGELPDLLPLQPTIGIPKKSIPLIPDNYPFRSELSVCHPHTIISFFEDEEVKNLYELPVTTSQFEARNLLKAFTVATARARQLYGENLETELPTPIVVQAIHTDGKLFHFGAYQLNTLQLQPDASGSGVQNYWFTMPSIEMYTECVHDFGLPHFEAYNEDCFRYLKAFYVNN